MTTSAMTKAAQDAIAALRANTCHKIVRRGFMFNEALTTTEQEQLRCCIGVGVPVGQMISDLTDLIIAIESDVIAATSIKGMPLVSLSIRRRAGKKDEWAVAIGCTRHEFFDSAAAFQKYSDTVAHQMAMVAQ